MTVRTNGYNHYGLDRDTIIKLFDYCQSKDFSHMDLLIQCANDCYPEIAEQIVESITKKLSYEKISFKTYIPLYKNDFYGYRRKCLALFYERLKGEIIRVGE